MAQNLHYSLGGLNITAKQPMAQSMAPGESSWTADGRRFCQQGPDVYVWTGNDWLKLGGAQAAEAIRLRSNSPTQVVLAFQPTQAIYTAQVSRVADPSSSGRAQVNQQPIEARTKAAPKTQSTTKRSSTSTTKKPLDSGYRQTLNPSEFFTVGTVFELLWTDPAGDGASVHNLDSSTVEKRRFVITKAGERCCNAVTITTYNGQGVAKPGVIKSQHAIIYTDGRNPPLATKEEMPLRGEQGMIPQSFEVIPTESGLALDPMSRIDFGRTYTISHDVKVKAFGMVRNLEGLVYVWLSVVQLALDSDKAMAMAQHKAQVVKNEEENSSEESDEDPPEEGEESYAPDSNHSDPIRPPLEHLPANTTGLNSARRPLEQSTLRSPPSFTHGRRGNGKISAIKTICCASNPRICFVCRLDSGADADFIKRDTVQRLGLQGNYLQSPKRLNFGNGDSMPLKSFVCWSWKLDDGKQGTSKFYILEHMVYDVILGVYTMAQHKMDVYADQSEKDIDPFNLDVRILGDCKEKQQEVIRASKSDEAASSITMQQRSAEKREQLNRSRQQQTAQMAQDPSASRPNPAPSQTLQAWARQSIDTLRRQNGYSREAAVEIVLTKIQQNYKCSREIAGQYLPSQ